MIEKIIAIIGLAFIALLCLLVMYFKIREWMLFKEGHNPFARICKKCGAHQNQYRSNIEGHENQTWWASVYPIGDDPDCRCHSYAEDREW